jgi:hypothetical protein
MGRRRVTAIIGLLCVATLSAAGLAAGLVSCAPGSTASGAGNRPVDPEDAGRLATARLVNLQDAQASFRALIRSQNGTVHVTGWIDWARPMIYLNSVGEQPGSADGLVQAVPGVMAVRAGRYPAGATPAASADPATLAGDGVTDPYPPPPATPPADGWRVRQMSPAGSASGFDRLLSLLLSLASPVADDVSAILAGGHTTVHAADLGGVPVKVYSGPAITTPSSTPPAGPSAATGASSPPPSGSGSPAMPAVGGTVQYWLDRTGRMRRVVADLGGGLPVQLDLARTLRQPMTAVPMLGGAAVTPRALTEDELRLVSRMRSRDRQSGGGTLTVTLPVNPAGLTTATGWLDWPAAVGYLALHNPDAPDSDQLVRVAPAGIAAWDGMVASGPPPLRPPAEGWHFSAWSSRGDAGGASDLDILLTQAVSVTSTRNDSLDDLRANASFLRTDVLAGVPVLVLEIRQASESRAAPGTGRLRYWVDGDGLLRRIEVRTRLGGFGWLDVTPAAVPALPDPRTS